MPLIDTHLHLYSEEFKDDLAHTIECALNAGVKKFLLPNIDVESIIPLKNLVDLYPHICLGMMGLHPCYVKEDFEQILEIIKKELYTGSYIAVGEIGIDLYWDKTTYNWQVQAFEEQCRWSLELNLPIVVHCRESVAETIQLVHEINSKSDKKLTGVFHCFSGDLNQALQLVDLGFYLGIGGIVTFKNGGIDKFLNQIPIDRIVLETDAPYLAPAPHRGKRNSPEFLLLIAQKVADVYGLSLEELEKITTENAMRLFKL